jgi:hypothetical protein
MGKSFPTWTKFPRSDCMKIKGIAAGRMEARAVTDRGTLAKNGQGAAVNRRESVPPTRN